MHARVLGGRKQMAGTKRVGGATSVRWTGRPLISKNRTARSRKAMSCIERKLEVLQELVPHGPSMQELDGLFREAANYIVCLQVQVKVMQILLDELSPEIPTLRATEWGLGFLGVRCYPGELARSLDPGFELRRV
ncbi:hypothetical protein BHM03_00053537 [Ensete ventricosum]|uniref:BHLH domain-containing protein n=1 Tax=Ensete ventricosum TaxID=4639 RepID=A0A445MLX8_ENSVE|nr:hypothetical protein BHM03_00053537 [Ensete ventricosum]